MLKKLIVKNFKGWHYQEFNFDEKGGVVFESTGGKTSFLLALRVLQKIGQGEYRVDKLFNDSENFCNTKHPEDPVSICSVFEIEGKEFRYQISAINIDSKIKVFEETLIVDGDVVLNICEELRVKEEVVRENIHSFDFYLRDDVVSLPIIVFQDDYIKSVSLFKKELSKIIAVEPVPSFFKATSSTVDRELCFNGSNSLDFVRDFLGDNPVYFSKIISFMGEVLNNFVSINWIKLGYTERTCEFIFKDETGKNYSVGFESLSSKEKALFLISILLYKKVHDNSILAIGNLEMFLSREDFCLLQDFDESGQLILTASKNLKDLEHGFKNIEKGNQNV